MLIANCRLKVSTENIIIFLIGVLISVTVISYVFLDVTAYIPTGVHRSFGEIYCLHLQGRRIREISNRELFVWLTSQILWWRQRVSPKHRWSFTRLHAITSQKSVFLTIVAPDDVLCYFFTTASTEFRCAIFQPYFTSPPSKGNTEGDRRRRLHLENIGTGCFAIFWHRESLMCKLPNQQRNFRESIYNQVIVT